MTLAGHQFAWLGWQTAVLVPGGVLLAVASVLVERRVKEPLIPLHLFQSRTVVLAVLASVAVGIALFGTTVFLSSTCSSRAASRRRSRACSRSRW